MDWIVPKETIEEKLLELEQTFLDPMVLCHQALHFCGELLESYRRNVKQNGFPGEADEIHFFKLTKPHILGHWLRYSKRLELALDYPVLNFGNDKTEIRSKMAENNAFLAHHQEMVLYLHLNQTGMDAHYFLRKNRNLSSLARFRLHHFDPDFSTARDGLVAEILAHQGFQLQLRSLLEIPFGGDLSNGVSKLRWTDSKTDLMELLLSLYQKGAVNRGNTTLKELVIAFQKWFGIDLGDHYHLAMRLRNRSNPTKYLERLQHGLQDHVRDLEA